MYGAGLIGQINPDGSQSYNITDQANSVLQTVRFETPDKITLGPRFVYSPYGLQTNLDQKVPKPVGHFSDKVPLLSHTLQGFNGQLLDPKSGYQFLGKGYHRAYNPAIQRFISEDSLSPFGKGGFNGYLFTNNNPIMYQDPSGHLPQWLGYLAFGVTALLSLALALPTEGASVEAEVAMDSVLTISKEASEATELTPSLEEAEHAYELTEDNAFELIEGTTEKVASKTKKIANTTATIISGTIGSGPQIFENQGIHNWHEALGTLLPAIAGAFGTAGMLYPEQALLFGGIDNGLEGLSFPLTKKGAKIDAASLFTSFFSGVASGAIGGIFLQKSFRSARFWQATLLFAGRGAVMETTRSSSEYLGNYIIAKIQSKNEMPQFNFGAVGKNIFASMGLQAIEGAILFKANSIKSLSNKAVRKKAVLYQIAGAFMQFGWPLTNEI